MSRRAVNAAIAGVLAIQAAAVAAVLATRQPTSLAVTADIGGGIQLASVSLGVAAVVLLVFSAVARVAAMVWANPWVRWVEWSQVSAVVVFLVAQLNGVQDVAALVALYALTAGASLFLVLHERFDRSTGAFSCGAAVAIVPWGIIAFYQVGAIVLGDEPSFLTRVLTLAMLLLAAAYWFAMRLAIAERAHTIIVAMTVSTLAWALIAV